MGVNDNEKPVMPMSLDDDEPEIVTRSYPSQIDTKKVKKKIRCLVVDAHKGTMPRLVHKPVNVSYGQKWFVVGGMKYWIIYQGVKDFGKFYTYMTQHGNAVGCLYFKEHEEYADANQVELMTQQHAVEVFKKHKGISPKLVMIIGIIAMVAIVGLIITVMFFNNTNIALNNERAKVTNLTTEKAQLNERITTLENELANRPSNLPPPQNNGEDFLND